MLNYYRTGDEVVQSSTPVVVVVVVVDSIHMLKIQNSKKHQHFFGVLVAHYGYPRGSYSTPKPNTSALPCPTVQAELYKSHTTSRGL